MDEQYTQSGKIIAIDSPLGEDVLLLTAVEGVDPLSRCFLYTLEFATKAADDDVRGLIGQSVTIWLRNHLDERQPVNGFIRRIIDLPEIYPGFTRYRAELVPRLWFLDCTSDCRIFQSMTYPDILKQIFQDYGVTDVQFKLLKTDYPVVDYCVQYRESALAFVSRLMEHAGIFYFHEHGAANHTLIITDSNEFTPYMAPQLLTLSQNNREGDIRSASTDTVFRPGAWALSDYDFEGPTKQMKQQVQTQLTVAMMPQHERFDFPGGYTDQEVGAWLAELRMQAEEAQFNRLLGAATVATMMPGYRFEFERDNGQTPVVYLLTEVQHHARDDSYFAREGGAQPEYHNDFIAIPASVPYRPPLLTPKSVMRGAQTATVVSASADDPIQTDYYGRVKVHFHWDRYGNPASGSTSCWLRVAQNSAGGGYGGVSIPHAGHEVIVDFLEGDPDRPLIVGRVHNADKNPPLDLPSDKHKTITRDHGNNKIVMEGAAGNQHLSLIAPRKLNFFAIRSSAQSLSSASASGAYQLPTLALNTNTSAYNDVQAAINAAYSAAVSASTSDVEYTTGQINVDSDSNSVTEADTNSFAGKDSNSWTYGVSNSWVGQGSHSVTYVYAYSNVFGASASFVEGNSSSIVMGGNESVVFPVNFGLTLGFNINIASGLNIDFTMSGNININRGKNFNVVFPLTDPDDADTLALVNPAITTAIAAGQALTSPTADWAVSAAAGVTMTAGLAWSSTAGTDWSATATGNMSLTGAIVSVKGLTSTSIESPEVTITAPTSVSFTSPSVTINGDIVQVG